MLKVGILGVAHVHTGSYLAAFRNHKHTDLVGYWDSEIELQGLRRFATPEALLAEVDAVVLSGTNIEHEPLAIQSAKAKKHILCEKPLATTRAAAENVVRTARANGVKLMTAFPCRFSPAYQKLKAHIVNGAIGDVVAIAGSNRGTCPFGWFVDRSKSGGGAMIDHVVHVADLLLDLLGEEPDQVLAHTGNNVYGQDWEDTAIVQLTYPSGVFATIDSSWAYPKTYKTWGEVALRVTGTLGVLDANLFGQEVASYHLQKPYRTAGFGSDLDDAMIGEFINAIAEDRDPLVTGEHGAAAVRVAVRAYESQDKFPSPEAVA